MKTATSLPRHATSSAHARARAAAVSASPFVERCGTSICLRGAPFPLYAASVLFASADPTGTMVRARAQGLNTVRLVNFLDESGSPSTAPFDEARWRAVDREIAAGRAAGLHVILDLSTYRNLLGHSQNPYTADWARFLAWVTSRRNTVSGVRYKDDPTIAMVSLAGEIEAPNSDAGRALGETTAQLTAFFARTAREFRAHDPNHLLSTGGLLQLDWDSGIDWRAIGSLTAVDVIAVHVYSRADRLVTLPAVAAWARAHAKPWVLEEFGLPQSAGDRARAAYFGSVITQASQKGAAGIGFWNSGPEHKPGSFDVNSSTPLTWAVVVSSAPRRTL